MNVEPRNATPRAPIGISPTVSVNNIQQSIHPTFQAAPAARASRYSRASQKPTAVPTLDELFSKVNDLITNAAKVPDYNKRDDLQQHTGITRGLRDIYPPHSRRQSIAVRTNSKNHSFDSKSPRNDDKPDFEIEGITDTPPEVYLIDAKNDGLCFINAIFDYLLYSGKLHIMYERLSAIEKLILMQDKYISEHIKNIRNIAYKQFTKNKNRDVPADYFVIDSIMAKNAAFVYDEEEQGQLIRLTGIQKISTHPDYEDYTQLFYTDTEYKVDHLGHPKEEIKTPVYEERRINFAISMKYMVALYILSYGKSKFTEIITDAIKYTLFIEVADGDPDVYRNEWNNKLRKHFKANYKIIYDKNENVEIYKKKYGKEAEQADQEDIDEPVDIASPEDIANFVYQYVLEYMMDKDFLANETLIIMFKKILFKKISDVNGKPIPRFWLEIEKALNDALNKEDAKGRLPVKEEYLELRRGQNITKFARVLNKYRFKTSEEAAKAGISGKKYIHTDEYDNYISLLCDENRTHYLLFLLKSETEYLVVDKPNPKPKGGKSKKGKTAGKTKKGKTAGKTKKGKTAGKSKSPR